MAIDIRDNEIKWVLTVPAIWSDPAKEFMRKSAEKVPTQRVGREQSGHHHHHDFIKI
jgi:hypothetical protein